MKVALDVGHRLVVLGMVGMTTMGGYTVVSGLFELSAKRKAALAIANIPKDVKR